MGDLLKTLGTIGGAAAKGAVQGAASGSGILSAPFKAAQAGISAVKGAQSAANTLQKKKYNANRLATKKANQLRKFKLKQAQNAPKIAPTPNPKAIFHDPQTNTVYGINKIPTNARPAQGPLPIYRRKAALPVK